MEIQGLEPPFHQRRVWLDATRDSDGESANEQPPPLPTVPVPAIPAEHAAAFRTPDPKRKSAPSGRLRRKADNPSASPEVISSLIDSFSILPNGDPPRSSPRLNGPKSQPATPQLRHKSSFGPGGLSGRNSLTDYEAYRQQLADDLQEPDAAEPPVIRTSKRPSGKSEWKAPKLNHESAMNSFVRSYGRSTSSLTSSHRGDDDARSIVSIDSTMRRRSLLSIGRESLDNRRLKRKGSRATSITREDLEGPETESVRELVLNATGTPDHLTMTPPTSPRRRAPFDSVIQEEPPSPTLFAKPNFDDISVKDGKKPLIYEPAHGPTVPNRRSSLRHQDVPHTNKHRISRDISGHTIPTMSDTVEELEEPQAKAILHELDGEPTEVTKRIKDLKARKEQRDREARFSPSPEPESGALRSNGNSPLAAHSPTFSDKQSKAADKKDRISRLGAINVPPRGQSANRAHSNTRPNGTSHRLDVIQQPGTPLTPTQLPINYSYVVSTLSKKESVASLGAAESLKEERRRSLGVGGRSAIGRNQASKSFIFDTSTGSSSSRQSTPEPPDDHLSVDTNAKSEKVVRTGSLRLSRRRWSQPDIPTTTAEKRLSMKRTESLAVQPPSRPEKIVEERPSSADSIDNDVKKFINHARLTQKIRHPLTGRTIAFSEVGDPEGHAVFCCVGMGLTRYVTAFYDELAMTLGLRLITPDRPGVGETPPDPNALPLNWPDDVLAICQALRISKFSIMAHSAGAIYALATALRMPQHIRGRVHLLAPWIPPSQMAPIGLQKQDPPPAAQLPKSQRFLRAMPAPFLKIANTGFLSAASASLNPTSAGTPKKDRRRKSDKYKRESDKENKELPRSDSKTEDVTTLQRPSAHTRRESIMLMDQQDIPDGQALDYAKSARNLRGEYEDGEVHLDGLGEQTHQRMASIEEENERREIYDQRLTLAIWALATSNANPAVDLLVCLERQREIGFMYKDITRSVVIHHGSKDTRVPVDNVKWLGRAMRKCEVRVLEGEGHGLMASAAVMGNVLEEMGREWKSWDEAVRKGSNTRRY